MKVSSFFINKTKTIVFSYISMIRLLPILTEQKIRIIPRDFSVLDLYNNYIDRVIADVGVVETSTCLKSGTIKAVVATITEEGTNAIEILSNLDADLYDNYIDIYLTSTIFKEENVYAIELTLDGNLWYRDKIYITSQSDKTAKHTINTNKYVEKTTSNDEYIIL